MGFNLKSGDGLTVVFSEEAELVDWLFREAYKATSDGMLVIWVWLSCGYGWENVVICLILRFATVPHIGCQIGPDSISGPICWRGYWSTTVLLLFFKIFSANNIPLDYGNIQRTRDAVVKVLRGVIVPFTLLVGQLNSSLISCEYFNL